MAAFLDSVVEPCCSARVEKMGREPMWRMLCNTTVNPATTYVKCKMALMQMISTPMTSCS